MSGVLIDVNARTNQSEANLESVNKALKNIEKSSKDTSAALSSMMRSLGGIAASTIATISLRNISDEFTRMSNQIALVTGRTKELTQVQSKLFDISSQTYSTVSSTADAFSSLGRSMRENGASSAQLLKATKAIQQGVALSGASAQTAAASLMQLGQGLSSGTLRGEELNSILEGTPRLAQAIADELGVSIGKLRIMAAEGLLTSDEVFGAMINQSKKLNDEFAQFKPTLGQAGTLFSDSLKRTVNEFDKGLGISTFLGGSLTRNANLLKVMADNAFEVGNSLRLTIQKTIGVVSMLAKPIGEILGELGTQFKLMFSQSYFTRTLRRDLDGALVAIDGFMGGALSKLARFNIFSFLDVRTEVEQATRDLKKLNPANWVGAGLNKATFDRFFSMKNLYDIVDAFKNLRDAIRGNTNTIMGDIENFGTEFGFAIRRISQYFGFSPDTLITFKSGSTEAFFGTLSQIVRGISGVSIKIYESGKLLRSYLAPNTEVFLEALRDSAATIGKSVFEGVKNIAVAIATIIKDIVIAIHDLNSSFSIKATFGNQLDYINKLFDSITAKSLLTKAIDNIKDFARAVINFFFNIYDEVIAHSWWTDTINGVVDQSASLLDRVKGNFSKFKSYIIGTFKEISQKMILGSAKALDSSGGSKLGGKMLSNANTREMQRDLLSIVGINSDIEDSFDKAFTAIGVTAIAGVNKVVNSIKSMGSSIKETFVDIRDNGIVSVWNKAVDSIPHTIDKISDFITKRFANLQNKAKSAFEDMSLSLVASATKMLDSSSETAVNIGDKIFSGTNARDMKRDLLSLVGINHDIIAIFDHTFSAIAVMAVAGLDKAYRSVTKFASEVIHQFFKIYDEVIGHSWWTDTIETIVDTSSSLWDRASKGLHNFKNNTSKLFEDIFSHTGGFKLDVASLKNIDLSKLELRMPALNESKMMDGVKAFISSTTDAFKRLAESFPNIMRIALFAVSGILISALFPASLMKSLLIGGIISSIASQSTLLAESFGLALTGGSFLSQVAGKLGELAGYMVKVFVNEIPQILNALLTVVSAFVKGFLSQLPLIGSAMASLFSAFGSIGAAGPLGLIGAYFFGSGIVNLLKAFKIAEKPIEAVSGYFSVISKTVTGRGDGIISKVLFGGFGPARMFSAIALVLDSMHAFDSMFAGSELMHYALEGGLLYTALVGGKGVGHITDKIGTSIISPISDAVIAAAKSAFGKSAVGNVFFGDKGVWTERAGKFIDEVFNTVNKGIISFATPFISKGYDFIKTILFGKDPKATIALLSDYFLSIKNSLMDGAKKIYTEVAPIFSEVGASLTGAFSKTKVNSIDTKGINDAITNVADKAKKAAGDTGILGTLFLGKYSKAAWVGIILLLASTAASASTDISKSLSTPMDDLATNWKEFKLDNPFTALSIEITAVSIPFILAAVYTFRDKIALAMASAFNVNKLSSFAGGLTKLTTTIKTFIPAIKMGIAGGIGAAIGYAIGDYVGGPEMAQYGLLAGATLLAGLGKAILNGITWLGSLIIEAVGGVALAIGAGIAAAGGALYLYFFGEKGHFLDELGKAKDGVLGLIGLGKPEVDKSTGISQDNMKFLQDQGIKLDYNLSDINTKNLKKSDTEKLEKSLKELTDATLAAIDEERRNGMLSSSTKEQFNTRNEGLKALSAKLESNSAYDPEAFQANLTGMRAGVGYNIVQDMQLSSQQMSNDIVFAINTKLLEFSRFMAVGQNGKRKATEKLDALNAEKDTKYNAKYRPLGVLEQQLVAFDKATRNLVNQDATLVKEAATLKNRYLKLVDEIRNKEQSGRDGTAFFGAVADPNYTLPANDPSVMKAQRLGGDILANQIKQLNVAYEAGQIKMFQNDVDNLSASLKDIGATFDSTEIFAKDNAAFDYLKSLAKDAKLLKDQLKQTRDVAEQNKIIVRIDTIKTEVNRIKIEAETKDNSQKQFKLKDAFSAIGIPGMDDTIYQRLPDALADKYFELSKQLQGRIESHKVKPLDPMAALGVGDKRPDAMIMENYRKQLKIYEKEQREIEAAKLKIEREFNQEVQSGSTAGLAFKDIANANGLDIGKVFQSKGIEEGIKSLNIIVDKTNEMNDALKDNDLDKWNRLNDVLTTMRDSVQIIPMSVSEFIGQISSLGSTFTLEDSLSLSSGTINTLDAAAKVMRDIDFQMQHMKGSFNKGTLDNLANRKLDAAKASAGAMLSAAYSTGTKQTQVLGKYGFADAMSISMLPQGSIEDFKKMDKEIAKLQLDLQDPRNSKQFLLIQENLATAQKFVDKMKADLSSINVRFESTNSAFGANLSKQEFANLPSDQAKALSDQALALNKRLELASNSIANGSNDPKVFKEFKDALDAQQRDSFKTLRYLQVSGVRQQTDTQALNYTPVEDLLNKITTIFPALSDFKDNLEKLGKEDLINIAKQALQVESDKRDAQLGLSNRTIDSVNKAANKTSDKVAATISPDAGLIRQLKAQGTDINRDVFSRMNKVAIDKAATLASELDTLKQKAISTTSIAARNKIQDLIDLKSIELDEAIKNASINMRKVSFDAGTTMATAIVDGFSASFTNLILKKTEQDKGNWITFRDSVFTIISENVIKTFVDGLSNAFMGEGGLVRTALQKVGSSIFDMGGKALSSMSGGTDAGGTDASAPATDPNSELLSGIGEFFAPVVAFLGSIFGVQSSAATSVPTAIYSSTLQITSAISTSTSAIVGALTLSSGSDNIGNILKLGSMGAGTASSFGGSAKPDGWIGSGIKPPAGGFGVKYAVGGFVSGAGTSISDSIPAMLSNGEFVVNAKQTAKFAPLLKQINDGNIKLATGGLVTPTMATPSYVSATPSGTVNNSSSTQQITINITGDISRQTRAEVHKMLPSIATGINSYNRERMN